MSGFLGLLFLNFCLFDFSRAAAKDAGHIHAFKPLLILCRRLLRFFKPAGYFWSFGLNAFSHVLRRLAAMENCGRFNSCLRFFLLFKVAWDRSGGFRILPEAALFPLPCGWFNGGRLMHSGLSGCARRLGLLAIFSQRLTRQHPSGKRSGGKRRRVQ